MTAAFLFGLVAFTIAAFFGGARPELGRLVPTLVVTLLCLPAGPVYAGVLAVSTALWLMSLRRMAGARRRERLAEACQEPLQAMFEQASLLGNAEHCAVSATEACPGDLRPLWQLAIADWARGAAADEAFARVAARAGLWPLERLARALALTRHTGTPLARHLAVLLEDVAEDLRLRREARGAVWPFAVATLVLAGAVLLEAIWIGAQGGGSVPLLAAVAGLTAGGAPLLAAEVAK